MREIGLVELNNIITDTSVTDFVYQDDNSELHFNNAEVDYYNMSIVLRSDTAGFLRTPVIKNVFIDDAIHTNLLFHSYERGDFEIQYIEQKT